MTHLKLLMALAALTFSLDALAAECPTRASWPTVDWAKTGTTNKAAQIQALEDFAFATIGTDRERMGIRTDGLIIIKGGNIIYEKYARGWSANKRHISWSVAKSISAAMVGLAVQKGVLNLEESICKYLTEYEGKSMCDIKVKHVITFGLGLQWQEDYEDKGYQSSSVISMLLGVGHRDQIGFTLSQNRNHEPGKQFIYSTGYAAVAAAVAKAALKPEFGNDAFWTQMFDKIGMSHTVFEEDPKGNPLGGSYVYAPLREFAKFGYLYLNDGCWAGERILPEGWVTQSATINDVYKTNRGVCTDGNAPAGEYTLPCETIPSGYMWWLNQEGAPGEGKPYKDLPGDMYVAIGHWGQYVMVVPSADVVIARVGDERNGCPEGAVDGVFEGTPCRFSLNKLGSLALELAK